MRFRNAFWICFLLAAPAVILAQEPPQNEQKPPEKATPEAQAPEAKPARPLTTAEKIRAQQPPAPKPGHPLDPADVDVLTGKTKSPSPYGSYGYRFYESPYTGQAYSPYGYGMIANDSVLSSPTGLFSPTFTFGDTGAQRFSVRNAFRPGMPILFLNNGSHRRIVFLGRGVMFF